MSILQSLFGVRKKPAAPFQVTSNIPPQENYAGYTNLPNLPMGDIDAAYHNEYRMHSPFQTEREKQQLITAAGVHFFDGADTSIDRVPDQALQQYLNQVKEVPAKPVYVPAHGVIVPEKLRQRGWAQAFVPLAGRRIDLQAASPQVFLSVPLRVGVPTDGGKRSPIKSAKAPKPKRG